MRPTLVTPSPPSAVQVFDRHRFQVFGRFEPEYPRVKVQLTLQGALDVLCPTEAVLPAKRAQKKDLHGPDIGPDGPDPERADYSQVVLVRRLRDALADLNPGLPVEARDDALRWLVRPEGSTPEARNRSFHRMLVDGVTVEHRAEDGSIRGAQVHILDFENPANNDWLAVNQFTVTENRNTRRPDVMLFVIGLPLGIIELKNPADEDATIWTAWQQLQTYSISTSTDSKGSNSWPRSTQSLAIYLPPIKALLKG